MVATDEHTEYRDGNGFIAEIIRTDLIAVTPCYLCAF